VPTLTGGSAEATIASGVGATTTDVAADADCTGLLLSITLAVKAEVPDWVGTPEIVPVDDVRVSPAGSLPAVIDQV
jgi:hypothetical protein